MAGIMRKTSISGGRISRSGLDTGGERGQGLMEKQTKKGEETSSQIGISRRTTHSKQILYVYIMQDNTAQHI
jgi:hypothetical protein